VQVFFKDGTASERVQVDYPIGHRKRRKEGMPVLVKKFEPASRRISAPSKPNPSKRCSRSRRSGCAAGERVRRPAGDGLLKNTRPSGRIMTH